MYERWKNKRLKRYIQNNNRRNTIEHKMRQFLKSETLSLSSSIFMKTRMNCKKTQKLIINKIRADEPFALIRFGLYEYMLCYEFLEISNGLRHAYSNFIREHICIDAGMFSTSDNDLNLYSDYILSLLENVDIVAYWRNIPPWGVFRSLYKSGVAHINVEHLYPFPFLHPHILPSWQKELRHKKVLIVSSFTETIQAQYQRRTKIWYPNEEILPEFVLLLYKAVQTNGGAKDERFVSWIEAKDYMLSKIQKIDFDIALISCGSYGLPLAVELKKCGKKAIQWGGCFQLWFGILGNRWVSDPNIQKYVNNSWTYPLKEETPPLACSVNNYSYWRKE